MPGGKDLTTDINAARNLWSARLVLNGKDFGMYVGIFILTRTLQLSLVLKIHHG
jgi:hypothetical protein